MAKIRFIIDNDGNISSEINGVKGDKCAKVDKFLETLGETKFAKTSEYFDKEQPNDVYIVGNGPQ